MLDDAVYRDLDAALAAADEAQARDYPGDSGTRQPIHTVYVPADHFTATTAKQWGATASEALEQYLPGPPGLADLLGVPVSLAAEVLPLVQAKLAQEPIEDLRVDFEDGYGGRADEVEDAAATAAGTALRTAGRARPPFFGIRFRSLEPATRRRGIRTLDLLLTSLVDERGLPPGFVITLPKVTHVDQVAAFVAVCAALEAAHGLDPGALRFEIQIEVPQAVLAADGSAAVARMVHAGGGRVTGLHYGTYDYSAAAGIAAPYQSLEHPAADHAKAVMQIAAAGTGVRLSDGSTNIVPVGSATDIEAAWRLHARLVRRALERGYYQGWDLHPLQLVTRYAATYAFYREGLPAAAERLNAYLGRADASGVLDEPATAQALAALLVRGLHCGALTADEVHERSGASIDELQRLYQRRVA